MSAVPTSHTSFSQTYLILAYLFVTILSRHVNVLTREREQPHTHTPQSKISAKLAMQNKNGYTLAARKQSLSNTAQHKLGRTNRLSFVPTHTGLQCMRVGQTAVPYTAPVVWCTLREGRLADVAVTLVKASGAVHF